MGVKKTYKVSKKGRNFVTWLNAPYEAYGVLNDHDKKTFELRWNRLLDHEATVLNRWLNKRSITQQQFDALLSFRMSIPSWTSFTMTRLARFCKDLKWELVPMEMMKFTTKLDGMWCHNLEFRRKAECKLWEYGMYPDEMPEDVWEQQR